MGVKVPSLRRKHITLQRVTGIQPDWYDCCIKGCMAFTGRNDELDHCHYCKEDRYRPGETNKSRKKFLYIPVTPRLLLQYRDPLRAAILKQYRADLTAESNEGGQLRDFWDGELFKKFHQRARGLFQNSTDVGFHLSLDAVQLTNMKTFKVRNLQFPRPSQ